LAKVWNKIGALDNTILKKGQAVVTFSLNSF